MPRAQNSAAEPQQEPLIAPQGALAFVPADGDRPSRWIYTRADLEAALAVPSSAILCESSPNDSTVATIRPPLRAVTFADVLDLAVKVERQRTEHADLTRWLSVVAAAFGILNRPEPPHAGWPQPDDDAS